MEEIERVITEEIPEALSTAMCGGWSTKEEVGEEPGPGGKISLVTGVPGRFGQPLKNLLSGMAWRIEEGGVFDDGFLFPDEAVGLTTTCDKATRTVMRWVWEPRDNPNAPGRYELQEKENPYFEDPPCDAHPDASGKQSPGECAEFCAWLNTYTYEDCRVFTRLESGEWTCVESGRKYTCSEEWETEAIGGGSSRSAARSASSVAEDSSASSARSSRSSESSSSKSASQSSSSDKSDGSSSSSDDVGFRSSQSSQSSDDVGFRSSSSFDDRVIIIDPVSSSSSQGSRSSIDDDFPPLIPIPVPPEKDPPEPPTKPEPPDDNPPRVPEPPVDPEPPRVIPPDIGPPEFPPVPPVAPPPIPPVALPAPPFPPPEDFPPLVPVGGPAGPPNDGGGNFFQDLFQNIIDFFSFGANASTMTTQLIEFPEEEFFQTTDPPSDPFDEEKISDDDFPNFDDFFENDEESDDFEDFDNENEVEREDEIETEPQRVVAEGDFVPNCIPCEGQKCRCPGPDCFSLPSRTERSEPSPLPARNDKPYPSFYRHYDARTERDSLASVSDENDVLRSTEMEIGCFGFYEEFDPKTKKISDADKRCSIAFPYSRDELLETQSVRAQLAPDPPAEGGEMPSRDASDTWYPLLGGMSFLREHAALTLTEAFLNLDQARMLGSPEIDGDRLTQQDRNLHGGDETVSNETGDAQPLVQWIHALQDEMTRLLTPPQARLRVPASWLPGLAREDARGGIPALVSVNIETDDDGMFDPHHASVDVQLDAGEDLQGILLKELEKMFSIREEIVPAVIPAGSPREFRDRALQWKHYARRREMLGLPYPSEVWLIVSELDAYAEQIEKYRALRAQLHETIAALTRNRERDFSAVSEWLEETVRRYRIYDEERSERLGLHLLVHGMQKELATFDDDVNARWCRQDGFTTPIYSLSHEWYPGSPALHPPTSCDGTEDALPLLCMPREHDLFIDFSRLVAGIEPLRIPVLHVIQVLPELPSPPSDSGPPPEKLTALAALPPLPTIDTALLTNIGSFDVRSLPPLPEFPEPLDLTPIEASLKRAQEILQNRNAAYAEFWDSLEPPEESFLQSLGFDDSDSETRLTCDGWNTTPCVHVEMDLLERVTRITALPGVHVREHLLVRGRTRQPRAMSEESREYDPNTAAVCDPRHDICAPPVHRVLHMPPTGFQVTTPNTNDASWQQAMDRIRASVRGITIKNDGMQPRDETDQIFPYVRDTEDLYPAFNVPPDVDLSPDEQ